MSLGSGNRAEDAAEAYLKRRRYRIIDRNWKRPYCEIDIVAKKKKLIYFVEVKYRSSEFQGDGLEYITPRKLEAMKFAAQCWVQEDEYDGEFVLSAISVSSDFTVGRHICEIQE